jgi:hypothetical protein
MDKKIEKNAVKSHRERVDEMNKFLDSLSDVRSPNLYDAYSSTMTCLKSDQAKTLSGICLDAKLAMWEKRSYQRMHGG